MYEEDNDSTSCFKYAHSISRIPGYIEFGYVLYMFAFRTKHYIKVFSINLSLDLPLISSNTSMMKIQ